MNMSDDAAVVEFHPQLEIRKFELGNEGAPLLVIDNLVKDPEQLVRWAVDRPFDQSPGAFPGIRAKAPPAYQTFISESLPNILNKYMNLNITSVKLSMCHYSLVTTPAEQLAMVQRIPHIDSLDNHGLASVHYLFKRNHGGTAFYRHRNTGYESIDQSRKLDYFRSLEAENDGPNMPAAEYISGDTALFEQIDHQKGVFNRILIYRRNSLHSGCIAKDFVPDSNPLTGRLSLNSFIDPVD